MSEYLWIYLIHVWPISFNLGFSHVKVGSSLPKNPKLDAFPIDGTLQAELFKPWTQGVKPKFALTIVQFALSLNDLTADPNVYTLRTKDQQLPLAYDTLYLNSVKSPL